MVFLGGNHGCVSGLDTPWQLVLSASQEESERPTTSLSPLFLGPVLEFGVLCGQFSTAQQWLVSGTEFKLGLGENVFNS